MAKLLPSAPASNRHLGVATELRGGGLRRRASAARARFAAQRRAMQVFEVSAGAIALATAVFLASLLGSPRTLQAGVHGAGIDPEQITLNAPKTLPAFEDSYQRHIGVLDTLR